MAITKKSSGSYGGAAVAEPPAPPRGSGGRGRQSRGGGADNPLSRRYGIDDSNLAMRRRFLRIDESDRELLMELAPWAKTVAAEIAHEFYDWQFEFEPTLRFFEDMAETKEVSLGELRDQLEGAQTRYFTEIFEGASSNWGIDYFEKRLKAGKVQDGINLPFKWYVGSYGEYQRLLPKYLKDGTKDPVKALRAERAINRIFNLDIQAIGDAFLMSTVESAGLNIEAIQYNGDKTECMADVKDALARLTGGVDALAKGDVNNELLDPAACERAGVGSLGRLASTIRKFITAMTLMGQEHEMGETDARMSPSEFEGAYWEMAESVNTVVAIPLDANRKTMACVAEFGKGNLDAPLEQFVGKRAFINTTVEAVRENLKRFISEMNHMSEEHDRGDIDVVMPATEFEGAYRTMAEGVNAMVRGHITVKKKAFACVAEFSKGNFDAPLEKFPGKKAFINEIVERLRSNLQRFLAEVNHMSEEHNRGEIDVKIALDNLEGDYRTMAQGVNEMVGGHIDVKRKTVACLTEFGSGNFDVVFDQLPGQKAFINKAVETVRGNLKRLIKDVDFLNTSAKEGRLGARANASDHSGSFRLIAETMNGVLEMLASPLQTVAQNSQTLASSAEELSAVSQQMAGNAEETAMQANVVSAASDEVSQNVGTVASGAEQMQASIREIAKNANEAARVAKNAVSVASQTNVTISKLGESSTEIGNVIKVITSIAQQTNLLALNATIEAARAGEAGKGFAVVANEVKELAKQTAKATEEIGQKIEAIQGDTKGAVKAIAEISGIINQINDISNSIASAVEEQTVTTNEISRSVAEAAKGTGDIAKNILGVAVAAKNTTQGASDTQKAAQELSRMAASLQTAVSRFQF
jgi:methyl-accepting chemotaxis protein